MTPVWLMPSRALGWTSRASQSTSKGLAAIFLQQPQVRSCGIAGRALQVTLPRRLSREGCPRPPRSICRPRAYTTRASAQRIHSHRPVNHLTSVACLATSSRRPPALPEDYNPEEGVQFRSPPLSQAEVAKIFGSGVDAQFANASLRMLHGLRLAGTVADAKALPAATANFNAKALKWLRKNHPVDEVTAYQKRLERDREELEQDLTADAESLGIYKPQQGVRGGDIYGKSGLDAIRKHYEQQAEKEASSQVKDVKKNSGTLGKTRSKELGTYQSRLPAYVKLFADIFSSRPSRTA